MTENGRKISNVTNKIISNKNNQDLKCDKTSDHKDTTSLPPLIHKDTAVFTVPIARTPATHKHNKLPVKNNPTVKANTPANAKSPIDGNMWREKFRVRQREERKKQLAEVTDNKTFKC